MVKLNNFVIDNKMPFTAILGPCQIESKQHAEECNSAIEEICSELDINYIFKSSFDKANRSSLSGKRGIGMNDGLQILSDIKDTGTPTLTDVHEVHQVKDVAKAVDVLQIPAFLCRQTDLLTACGDTGKIVPFLHLQFFLYHHKQSVNLFVCTKKQESVKHQLPLLHLLLDTPHARLSMLVYLCL